MTDTELASHEWWESYREVVNGDPELGVRGHDAFDENFYVEIGDERTLIRMNEGEIEDVVPNPTLNHRWSFGVEGSREAWEEFVSEKPPAFNHEIIASHYRSAVAGDEGHLQLTGDNKKVFQNLRAFQRTLELMRVAHNGGSVSTRGAFEAGDGIEPIAGNYVHIDVDGTDHRVYYEENGPEDGIPLLCQHTAGCNNGEWRHLLSDESITDDFRVIAYDLPYHGKSVPPTSEPWWEEDYTLTAEEFAETIVAIADALEIEDPIYMGSSMGGNVTLELADWYPERFRALIGLECGAHSPGFYIDWLDHPHINTTEVNAYACWGLMAPQSPEQARRETMYHYEQGATGVFKGDLYYYSVDHDYRGKLDRVNAEECPLYIVNGEYDYLTTPEDGRETAEGIGEGATAVEMGKIGHFPMSEHPELFNAYLGELLADVTGEREGELPDVLSPADVGVELGPSAPDAS
ncbi:alpha/beta hydrolase [Halalkalicoccus tibetensis]|uniref:Alpha/beta fold hydrolase n=1 Tax=Halalkalicoccus tibetensis TaxID=175632 RepID=A0ABD5V0X6_9EURY